MTLPCPCSSRGRRGMSQALQVTALNGVPLPESCHPPGSGGRCASGKAPPGPQGPVSTGTGTPAPGLTLRHSQLYAIFLVTPIKKQKETKMVFMNSKKDNIFLRRYSVGQGVSGLRWGITGAPGAQRAGTGVRGEHGMRVNPELRGRVEGERAAGESVDPPSTARVLLCFQAQGPWSSRR